MLRGEEDYNSYFEDTMKAGHYENNKGICRCHDPFLQPDRRGSAGLGVDFERNGR